MGKSLYIAETEVAQAGKARKTHNETERLSGVRCDCHVVCRHLVTMSYPEVYDEKYK